MTAQGKPGRFYGNGTMPIRDLQFKHVNLDAHLDVCLAFRRDTHRISYGTDQDFSASEAKDWFNSLAKDYPDGFLHAVLGDEIVGQLEFRSALNDGKDEVFGYVNLFYLQPNYRQRGFGQLMHDYVLARFRLDKCSLAYLRYIPGNHLAERFYIKNGWQASGEPGPRGQLMIKTLAT